MKLTITECINTKLCVNWPNYLNIVVVSHENIFRKEINNEVPIEILYKKVPVINSMVCHYELIVKFAANKLFLEFPLEVSLVVKLDTISI